MKCNPLWMVFAYAGMGFVNTGGAVKMGDYDPADLDGDGEFDGIDIAFLEDEDGRGNRKPARGNSGCCVVLFVIGSSVSAGWWIDHTIIGSLA